MTSTALLLNPALLGAALGVATRAWGVASRWMVTDFVAVPPELVAEQVSVVPAVSALMLVLPQPVVEEIVESGSVTLQDTLTSLVYQPLLPAVPDTLGVITGGVESEGAATFTR